MLLYALIVVLDMLRLCTTVTGGKVANEIFQLDLCTMKLSYEVVGENYGTTRNLVGKRTEIEE
jgi:hypothetical protein